MNATSGPGKVATVGIHIVDILGRHVEHIPDGQGVAIIEEIAMTVAGTAAGTAVDLAKLGLDVATFGVVGTDELGAWLRTKMGDIGIDVRGISSTSELPTSATLLPIRPNGDRPALHVPGANALLGAEHLDWDVIESCEVVHIGGSCLLPRLDGLPTALVLERARAADVVTTLDLIGMPDADHQAIFGPCYPHLDYFMPNDEDAIMLSGQTTLADAASWLLDQGVGAAIISLGPDGVLVALGQDREVVPAYRVDVVDTTGCGDAFSAGFIAGLIDGHDPVEAARFGAATGSMVATGLGSDAGIVDRQSVHDFMATVPLRPSDHIRSQGLT